MNTENQISSAKAVRETLAAKPDEYDHVNTLDQLVKRSKKQLSVKCVNLVLQTKLNSIGTFYSRLTA